MIIQLKGTCHEREVARRIGRGMCGRIEVNDFGPVYAVRQTCYCEIKTRGACLAKALRGGNGWNLRDDRTELEKSQTGGGDSPRKSLKGFKWSYFLCAFGFLFWLFSFPIFYMKYFMEIK